MPAINITDLNNAQRDVDHIAEVATSMAATATDRLGNVKSTVSAAVNSIKAFNPRGAWTTATDYAMKDLYTSAGTTYATVVAHISTSIAADLAAGKVAIYQGVAATAIATPVTSAYATFADALAAAAGKTLVVNSAVNIAANTTIPATVAVEVVRPGMLTISAGVTLTISGHFTAGSYQVFSGAGSVQFTASSRSQDLPAWYGGGQSAVYSQSRQLKQNSIDPGGPVHAFEDNNTLDFTYAKAANFNAYAAFDANTTATGAGAYDHIVGFQSRQTYSGSNEIWSRMDGFNCLHTHNGTGRVAMMRGVHIENPLGGGRIDFLAGVFIQRLNRGAESYGIYSATPANVVSVGGGEAATWTLRGNGQTGGYGLVLQSGVDGTARVLQTANLPLFFGTNNVITAACTADGRWKMSAIGLSEILTGAQQLEVAGVGGATFKATGGAGSGPVLAWNAATTGDPLLIGFYTETAAAARGSIDFNRTGGLTRYNTTSDGTLKNIIGDASPDKSLEILRSTRLRDYSWKDDPTEKVQIGPIAQELHETFKGAVSVGGWYEETIGAVTEQRMVSPAVEAVPAGALLDEHGTPYVAAVEAVDAVYETVVVTPERIEERYRPWGVDKTAFTFHLVAGHQHHTKEIADLRAAVAALTKRLAKLESR